MDGGGVTRAAGVVLAGGRSSRMGTAKAVLEWHGSTLLRRTCGVLLRAGLAPVVVVRAPGQPLPPLPPGSVVVEDRIEGLGPLAGIAAGLAAAADHAQVAFVASTDLPFLHPLFVRRVLRPFGEPGGEDVDAVLPVARGHAQPLAAAYRTRLGARAGALVAEGRLRPAFLLDTVRVRELDDQALLGDPALADADPDLDSLLNVNGPDDYAAARARPAPPITVQCLGVLAAASGRAARPVQAATVGAAAAAARVTLDRHVLAAVNGDQTGRDPETPLVAGDEVAFFSAAAGG